MMYALSARERPDQRYRSLALASRIEAANPHDLVCILYEELIGALDVLAAAIGRGRREAAADGRSRASTILVALQASLDPQRGGDLARSLSGIYRGMQAELAKAVREEQPRRIMALREGAADLLAAWKRIAAPL